MCGIAGVFDSTGQHLPLDDDIQRMTAVLRHRGPDDEGYVFVDPSTGRDDERRGRDTIADFTARDVREGGLDFYRLAFGFRRLAIIDLSPAGHQPMASRDRSLWIVFNGELYNYLELRDTLKSEGHVFHTESDTEVVLSSYTQWGEGCLQKFNGMWAFALWDGRRRRLFCARDRFGIKPLYYTWRDGMFLFASEIKALLAANGKVERRPNQERVVDYLIDRRLDHTSETMFDGIAQISAGCHVSVDSDGVKSRRYWNIVDHKRSYAGYDDAVDEFRELFRDAVRLHLRSDVSTGSCLSGGIDSSSIVCMARKLWDGGGRIQTFSACFAEKECDESAYIASVHRQGKIDANYIYPTASSLLDQLDSLVWHQEEPFVSSSMYAQWEVMKRARQQGVVVLLDGQGADELLGGYPTYYGSQLADLIARGSLSTAWREYCLLKRHGWGIHRASIGYSLVYGLSPRPIRAAIETGRRLGRGRWLSSNARRSGQAVPDEDVTVDGRLGAHLYRLLTAHHLPALLHYEDRNSMAFSVEARVPFLDYRVAQYLFHLPSEWKLFGGRTKRILRDAMRGIVPNEVLERTDKMGFVTPESRWLQGPLRERVRAVLSSKAFRERGYVDPAAVQRLFQRFEAGELRLAGTLWRCMNLERWFNVFWDEASRRI